MRRLRSSAKRVMFCELGAAAVEFAIVSSLFIVFILGIIDVGRALDLRNQLARAADAGARTVLVPKSANLEVDAVFAAKAALTTGDPNELTVSLQNVELGGIVYWKITLIYPFRPIFVGFVSPTSFSVGRVICPISECVMTQ